MEKEEERSKSRSKQWTGEGCNLPRDLVEDRPSLPICCGVTGWQREHGVYCGVVPQISVTRKPGIAPCPELKAYSGQTGAGACADVCFNLGNIRGRIKILLVDAPFGS